MSVFNTYMKNISLFRLYISLNYGWTEHWRQKSWIMYCTGQSKYLLLLGMWQWHGEPLWKFVFVVETHQSVASVLKPKRKSWGFWAGVTEERSHRLIISGKSAKIYESKRIENSFLIWCNVYQLCWISVFELNNFGVIYNRRQKCNLKLISFRTLVFFVHSSINIWN